MPAKVRINCAFGKEEISKTVFAVWSKGASLLPCYETPYLIPIPRLPRYNRTAASPAFIITNRDREIIRFVYSHRFLRSSQIAALIGASRQPVLRRLQLLFHHGYLTRPRAQVEYFTKGGSREIVYGLGNKGAKSLCES